MKLSAVRKLYTRLQRRRNKAQREYSKGSGFNWMDLHRTRLDAEVITLDRVLDDLDRLIANNHDRFHDRSRK